MTRGEYPTRIYSDCVMPRGQKTEKKPRDAYTHHACIMCIMVLYEKQRRVPRVCDPAGNKKQAVRSLGSSLGLRTGRARVVGNLARTRVQ